VTGNENAENEPAEADEVEIWPVRPTAARSMRPGDEMLVPSNDGPWPQAANHGRITDIREDEASGMITINGELIRGASGLFEKPAHPGEAIYRLLQPGDPAPGTESIWVRGVELWKWIGEQMDDPHGSTEKYILTGFRRANDPELGEIIQVKMQSMRNPRKLMTADITLDATARFDGHR
jgi:hypothetical protein